MSVKGTKTEKNLWLAFAGECQTRSKYLSYSIKAKEEGHDTIAEAFYKTAKDEDIHASEILGYLGAVNNTLSNLKLSVQSEYYEAETLYREFERVARAEGLEDIATFFNHLCEKEAQHQAEFLELAKELSGEKK